MEGSSAPNNSNPGAGYSSHEKLEGVLFAEFESELKIVGRHVTSGAVCQALAVKMVEGAPAREHRDGWSRDGLLVDDDVD